MSAYSQDSFTPRPWNVGGEWPQCFAVYHDAYPIAVVYTGEENPSNPWLNGNPIGRARAAANARLIAAAPDLVEALECLLPGLILDLRYADEDDDKDAMRSRIKTVTDALAKAYETQQGERS